METKEGDTLNSGRRSKNTKKPLMYPRVYNKRTQQQVLHATFFNYCMYNMQKDRFLIGISEENAYIIFEVDFP